MGGVVIAAATIILYTPWLPFFDLREIAVRETSHLKEEEIKRLAGFRLGENLFCLRVRRAAETLSHLPWMKEVTIRRVFPHRVEILVHERAPIAVVEDTGGAGPLVIGEGGIVLEKPSDELRPLLVVQGVHLSGDEPGARLTDPAAIDTLERLHRHALTQAPFRLVNFTNRFSVTLRGEKDLLVYLGPLEEIGPRIDALAALLQTIEPTDYRSIDLRFEGEAILVPRKVVNR